MTMMTPGYQPYHPSFALFNPETHVELDPLVRPIKDTRITGFHCLWRDIYFEPQDIDDINAVLNAFKAEATLGSLALDSGLELPFVHSIVQTLYELGIVRLHTTTAVSASAFYHHVVACLRAHRHKMLQHNPILSLYEPHTITKKQLVGYLIEAYHFSASAASHISLAVTQAPSKKIEMVLSHYLAEEYWHGNLLAKGIARAGVSKETLQSIQPTFPILGIINFLRHVARTDLQAYGLCIALTEGHTSPTAIMAKQDVWEAIKAMQLVPDETLDVFYEHDVIDHNAKHDEVPEVIFPADEMISLKRQQELLTLATLYIDMIGDAYQNLKTIYAEADCPYWFERQ